MTIRSRRGLLRAAAAATATVLLAPVTARAQSPAEFYTGKTITFVVGYAAGASFDTGARLIGRHLGKHIPGKPNVIIQNMPGAGSMTAANFIYNAAPKDGTAIAMFGRGLFLEALFGNPAARFDPLKLNWIGSYGREVSVLVASAKSPFKTVEDIRNNEMLVSASGPGADTYAYALVLNALIGAKLKIIGGYPGQSESFLAVDRGEVHGNAGATIGSISALRPQWFKEPGHVNFVVQLATERHPTALQGVPLVTEFARNDVDRGALDLTFSRLKIAYAFTAPPDIPADRLAALRAGFDAAVKDPEFLADAAKANMDVAPVNGEGVLAVIRGVYAMPKEIVARAKSAMTVDPAK